MNNPFFLTEFISIDTHQLHQRGILLHREHGAFIHNGPYSAGFHFEWRGCYWPKNALMKLTIYHTIYGEFWLNTAGNLLRFVRILLSFQSVYLFSLIQGTKNMRLRKALRAYIMINPNQIEE